MDFGKFYKALAKKTGAEIITGDSMLPIHWLPTGIPLLDVVTGGGVPQGRITHCCGESSVGKSLLGLWLAKMHQIAYPNGNVVYIDTERALGSDFCRKVGVDMSKLAVVTPETVEMTFDVMDQAAEAVFKEMPGENLLIVWDSVAATVSAAEKEEDYDSKAQPARLAAACSRGMKKLRPVIAKTAPRA